MPLHTDELLVEAKRIRGSSEEHHGTPCRTPDTWDVSVHGVIRITYDCGLPEGTPMEGAALDLATWAILDQLESEYQAGVVVTEPESGIRVRLLTFGFRNIGPREAIGTVLNYDVLRR